MFSILWCCTLLILPSFAHSSETLCFFYFEVFDEFGEPTGIFVPDGTFKELCSSQQPATTECRTYPATISRMTNVSHLHPTIFELASFDGLQLDVMRNCATVYVNSAGQKSKYIFCNTTESKAACSISKTYCENNVSDWKWNTVECQLYSNGNIICTHLFLKDYFHNEALKLQIENYHCNFLTNETGVVELFGQVGMQLKHRMGEVIWAEIFPYHQFEPFFSPLHKDTAAVIELRIMYENGTSGPKHTVPTEHVNMARLQLSYWKFSNECATLMLDRSVKFSKLYLTISNSFGMKAHWHVYVVSNKTQDAVCTKSGLCTCMLRSSLFGPFPGTRVGDRVRCSQTLESHLNGYETVVYPFTPLIPFRTITDVTVVPSTITMTATTDTTTMMRSTILRPTTMASAATTVIEITTTLGGSAQSSTTSQPSHSTAAEPPAPTAGYTSLIGRLSSLSSTRWFLKNTSFSNGLTSSISSTLPDSITKGTTMQNSGRPWAIIIPMLILTMLFLSAAIIFSILLIHRKRAKQSNEQKQAQLKHGDLPKLETAEQDRVLDSSLFTESLPTSQQSILHTISYKKKPYSKTLKNEPQPDLLTAEKNREKNGSQQKDKWRQWVFFWKKSHSGDEASYRDEVEDYAKVDCRVSPVSMTATMVSGPTDAKPIDTHTAEDVIRGDSVLIAPDLSILPGTLPNSRIHETAELPVSEAQEDSGFLSESKTGADSFKTASEFVTAVSELD